KRRIIAQGHIKEEGKDYDEVFAPVARIEAIKIFLAFASYIGFIVYQMDVKSAFLDETIEEEVYVCQPHGFIDPQFLNKVYKVEKALYGLHKLPEPDLMHKRFQMSSMGELTLFLRLQVTHSKEGIFISQDKFQVTPKLTHLHDVKRIFRKYKTGGCQFLGRRLISWQCKKQTIVATFTTEVEYVAAANCCGHVLWIQNRMLDYGFNFMHTKIYIDNESTICIVKNPGSFSSINLYMANLKFVDQHNMVACLERTEANAEFHQIVDFLSTCSINYALTVSPTIYASYIEQFWNTATSKTINSVKQVHAIVDGKDVVISESSIRSDLLFNDEDGGDDSVERAITTDASLVAEQDSDNITKTQSTAMSNDHISQEIGSGNRTKCQETTLGDMDTQTRFETASKQSHDLSLLEVNTSGSGEDSMEHQADLTDVVPPTPHDAPLSGGHTPGSDKDKGSGEKCGSTADQVSTARLEVSTATLSTPPTPTTIFGDEDLTIAQTLIKLRSEKAKEKRKFDEFQAKIDADHELAVRMTHEEQEMYKIEERARLLSKYFERRNKQLAPERAEAIRNKPPTRTQVRNHDDYLPQTYRQKMMQEQESTKSVEEESTVYEHEKEELRMWLTVVLDEEETVDPEIFSTKYPIVDWESQILGNVDTKNVYVYKIIRANRNTSYHKSLSSMLRKFNKQDLVDLHRLVMKRFENNTPGGYNLLLWEDLKVIFEPNAEDEIWKKRYPFIKEILEKMLNWKIEAKAESIMAFKLLKFIKSHVEE
nr:copia protein [Tanacetum cinerariifolium]